MEDFYELTNYNYFSKLNDQEKSNKLIEIIKIISQILNHHRTTNFFIKIEQILSHFKENIKKTFSNSEIFNLFRHNKRILLFLFKEKILTINESIAFWLSSKKNRKANYYDYFLYEILSFFNGESIDINEDNFIIFDKKRKIGENDNYICNLIRNDHVEEFIAYVNKTNLSLLSVIPTSIFETNKFLINKDPTLIEYSAFFGSIQIFRYLLMNKVELTPSLWIYAIHSNNADLIHLLEENNLKPNDDEYNECFIESIKCNHTDFAKYIQNIYLSSQDLNELSKEIIKYCNYEFFPNNLSSPNVFYFLVLYNYPFTVDNLLKNTEIDINYRYNIKTDQILAKRQYSAIDKIEQTLIHAAIREKNKEIVKILVSNPKLNIKEKMIYNQEINEVIQMDKDFPHRSAVHKVTGNALHFAIETGNIDIVQMILSHSDIDINDKLNEYDFECIEIRGYYAKTIKCMKTNVTKTSLHIALNKGYADIAQLLLSRKIKLVDEIKEGEISASYKDKTTIYEVKTALYIAIQNSLNDIIKFLILQCNIDVNDSIIFNEDDLYEEGDENKNNSSVCIC